MRAGSDRPAVGAQGWVLIAAAALWVAFGGPTLVSLLLAYAAGLGLVWAITARRRDALDARLSRPARLLGALVLALPVVATCVERAPAFVEGESLLGLPTHLSDRWALERTPAIAPITLTTDRPQRFYVHAPGADAVRWSAPGTRTLDATALGHGLFRVDHDPRRDGEATGGTVTLSVDGAPHTRHLEHVEPTSHPRWLRSNPSRTLSAAVSEETDALIVVDAEGFVARGDTGDRPRDLVFLDDATIAIACDDGIWVHDVATGRGTLRRPLASPRALALRSGALVVAVGGSDAGLLALPSSFDGAPTRLADLPEEPDQLVCTETRCAVALRRSATVAVIGEVRRIVPLGRPAVTMALASPNEVLVATTGLLPTGPHLGNHFVQDQLLTLDLDRAAIIDRQPTARRTERQGAAGDVDRGLGPMGIAIDGSTKTIAFAGSDEVAVFRAGAPLPSTIDLGDTPLFAPHGVSRFSDGTLAVSSPGAGAIGLFRGGSLQTLVRADPDEPSAVQQLRRRGEHTFYEATRSGVACQSCHLHGDTDHALRNIGGRRLAPTLTVRGVAGTAPYLRDGSYPRIADLTHLSTTLLRGWLRREPERGAALEAYVRSLPRELPPGDRDPRPGLEVFVQARCPSCHAFPAFSTLGSVPHGALFPNDTTLAADERLDTPSLLSVATRGPFLADGRAPTLRAIFEGEDRHGDHTALTESELDDLVVFLESL